MPRVCGVDLARQHGKHDVGIAARLLVCEPKPRGQGHTITHGGVAEEACARLHALNLSDEKGGPSWVFLEQNLQNLQAAVLPLEIIAGDSRRLLANFNRIACSANAQTQLIGKFTL